MSSGTSCQIHPNMDLLVVCSLETCLQKTIGCLYCLQEFHSDHPDSCSYLDDLIGEELILEDHGTSNINPSEIQQINQAFDKLSDDLTNNIDLIEYTLQNNLSHQQTIQKKQVTDLESLFSKCYSLKTVGDLYEQFKVGLITQEEFLDKIQRFLEDRDRLQQIAETKQMLKEIRTNFLQFDENEITLSKVEINTLCQLLLDVFKPGDQNSFVLNRSHYYSQNALLSNNNKRLMTSLKDSITYVHSAFTLQKGTVQWSLRINKVDPSSMGLSFGIIEDSYKLQHNNAFKQGSSIYWNVFNNGRVSYAQVSGKVLGPILKTRTEPIDLLFSLDFQKKSFKIDCKEEQTTFDFTSSNIVAQYKEAGQQFVKQYFTPKKTFRFFIYCQSAAVDLELL